MIGVTGTGATLDSYRSGIAELPESTFLSEDVRGSIAVVSGEDGWPGRALAAVEAGAVGVVVTDPVLPRAHELAHVMELSERAPVALDRALLRPDCAGDAHVHPPTSLLTAICAAPTESFEKTVCDTIGWLRVMGSGPPVLRAARRQGDGVLATADVESPVGGFPAVVTARTLAEGVAVPRLRVTALGAVRTEVTVTSGSPAVIRSDDERGAMIAALRFENRRRLALRRVLVTIATRSDREGAPGSDRAVMLADAVDYVSDAALTLGLLAAAR
jgi:hypothetical protein